MKRDAVHAQNYIAMQIESLESEETNRQEIKILKHDLRNHLQVIQEMCNTKQYAQMESYISELSPDFQSAWRYNSVRERRLFSYLPGRAL